MLTEPLLGKNMDEENQDNAPAPTADTTPLAPPDTQTYDFAQDQVEEAKVEPKQEEQIEEETEEKTPLQLATSGEMDSEAVVDDNGDTIAPLSPPTGGTKPKRVSTRASSGAVNLNRQTTQALFNKYRSALPSVASNCNFEWRDINVYVGNDPKNRRQILHNFNGIIRSGELLAVMGGSGAGKSTFLNALSGRTNLNEQYISGELAINGKKFPVTDQKLIRSVCCYVPQSDLLCPTQTVEEALMFYAKLRLPNLTLEEQTKRVNYLINVLHLDSCRNNLIGDEKKRGVSGGEKRRVSIAAEILNDVDLIFLDEPTSGLDAYTAARCIKTLKEFSVHSNKIIIATIHQPSIEVFYLFDRLMLLSNGECCYHAETEEVPNYFASVLRPKTNPADVILFSIQRKGEKYVSEWAQSPLNVEAATRSESGYKWQQSYNSISFENIKKKDGSVQMRDNTSSAALSLQYKLLLQREVLSVWRDRRIAIIRLLQVILFSLTVGLIFYQVPDQYAEKLQALILLCLIAVLFGMVSLLTAYPAQKQLFQRENTSDTYSGAAWALSFMIIEIPREFLVHMLLFTCIVYPMCGFDGTFLEFWMALVLCSVTGGSCGIFLGTMARSSAEAAQMMPAALVPLIMFSGALVELRKMPTFFMYIAYMDPMYYLISMFWIIEFEGESYARTLDPDAQEICAQYETYQNGSSLVNSYLARVDNCTFVIDAVVNQYNISNFDGLSAAANNISTISTSTSTSTSTTLVASEYERKMDAFCMTEVPASFVFRRKQINPEHFANYVICTVAICVVLRILAVCLLYLINNNRFSWIKKQCKMRCCCCCQPIIEKLTSFCSCCDNISKNNKNSNTHDDFSSAIDTDATAQTDLITS